MFLKLVVTSPLLTEDVKEQFVKGVGGIEEYGNWVWLDYREQLSVNK